MFQVDDYLVYSGNGVCKVKKVGPVDMGAIRSDKIYYTLEPIYSRGSTVYTPVDNDKVVMREMISKEDAQKLINDIPDIAIIEAENDKQKDEKYKTEMQKYQCCGWAQIIKSIYAKKQDRIGQGKKLSSTDERYLHMVEECLYGELAAALSVTKEEIEIMFLEQLDKKM